jgi:hypothetical protein
MPDRLVASLSERYIGPESKRWTSCRFVSRSRFGQGEAQLEHRHRVTRLIGIIATLAVAFAIASVHLYRPVGASGATLTVDGQGNEDPANGLCDLEEAVKAAVTDSNYNDCTASGYGDDTIVLSGTVTLTNSLLVDRGGNLTLTGGGTIQWAGLPTVRLMWISGPLTVRIEGLTLRGNQNP